MNCLICKKYIIKPQNISKNHYKKRKYCSYRCSRLGRNHKMLKVCSICKKEFYKKRSDVKNHRGKYCSKKCKQIAGRTACICQQCKKVFYTYKSTKHDFCDRKCYTTYQRENDGPSRIQKGNSIKPITRIKKKCLICKKIIFTYPSHIKIGKGNYCSRKCANDALIEKFKVYHPMRGKHFSKEHIGKLKKAQMKLWGDKNYREKQLKLMAKGLLTRPTSLEKKMIAIIQNNNLPYRYTGDGSFLIGFKNPDFVNINGEKKLIEVGNVFHHQGDYVEKRREHFAKYGWKSYIFIGQKLNEEEILKTIV